MQHNSADCGLFLLAFLEHFIYDLPSELNYRHFRRHRSLFLILCVSLWLYLSENESSKFLTSKWLDPDDIGRLRDELLHFMYRIYWEQLSPKHPAYHLLQEKLKAYLNNPLPKSIPF